MAMLNSLSLSILYFTFVVAWHRNKARVGINVDDDDGVGGGSEKVG